MIKTILKSAVLITWGGAGSCFAQGDSQFYYDKNKMEIIYKSLEITRSIKFTERDEGNSSYFFDFFGERAAIVHDSSSLDSYSSYSTLKVMNGDFYNDCIYLEYKSGTNGVFSRQGVCDINERVGTDAVKVESISGEIINSLADKSNSIQTAYLMSGEVKYLPLLIFRSDENYIFQLYKSREDLVNGVYQIFSCRESDMLCDVYNKNTWVVFSKKNNKYVTLKYLDRINGKDILLKPNPESKINMSAFQFQPFKVTSAKAYLFTSELKQINSYLIKNDMINIISVSDGKKWCAIRYINKNNVSIDSNVKCADLSI